MALLKFVLLALVIFCAVLLITGLLDFVLNIFIHAIPGADEAIDEFVGKTDKWWWDSWTDNPDPLVLPKGGELRLTAGIWDKIKDFINWLVGKITGFIDWIADNIKTWLEEHEIASISVSTARIIAIGVISIALAAIIYIAWRVIA